MSIGWTQPKAASNMGMTQIDDQTDVLHLEDTLVYTTSVHVIVSLHAFLWDSWTDRP